MGTWRRRQRNIRRLAKISEVAARNGFGYLMQRYGLTDLLPKKAKDKMQPELSEEVLAKRIRKTLEELGPTFIKIGQLVSVRPDLFPPEVIFELEKLQDSVPPMDYETVTKVLEKDLGREVKDIFAEFNPKPIGSASIGQVHRAKLKDGQAVVVKVQRPEAQEMIDSDLDLVFQLAELVRGRVHFVDTVALVQEFSDSLHRELDYRVEGKHVDKFHFNFRDDPLIKIPLVYWKHSSRRVLTMEYVEGTKLTDLATPEAAGIDTFALAKHGAEAFMKQVLDNGFFHGDLHPANILVTSDGKIGYLDFGIVGAVPPADREVIALMLVAIIRRDIEGVVKQAQKIGVEISPDKIGAMREELKEILDRYYGRQLGELPIDIIGREFLKLIYRHRIRIPKNYALLAKGLITVEGVAKSLYPEINILEIAKPYVAGLVKRKYPKEKVVEDVYEEIKTYSSLLLDFPKQLHDIFTQVRGGELQIKYKHVDLETLISSLDRATNRLAVSLILAAIILSSSLVAIFARGTIWAPIGFIIAAIFGLWLIVSILRSS